MKTFLMVCGVLFIVLMILGVGIGVGYYMGDKRVDEVKINNVVEEKQVQVVSTPVGSVKPVALTALPLGDKKYSSSAQKGYIYPCRTTSDEMGGGAGNQGPWIDTTNKTWDATKKVHVDGNVSWPQAKWTVSKDGTKRTLSGNGLPINHTTGTYPIQSSDDAYKYDRNPNGIKEQSMVTYSLPTNPTLLATPECVGGEVGVMLSGVLIFNGFDAQMRDAAAWEIQDNCGGHPQKEGQYHYHSYSKCLKDETKENEHSGLVGYAWDGFGVYGLKGEGGVQLTAESLDECHGHTHEVEWDGVKKSMYHYHMTNDFPYSVGCFRGKKAVKGPAGTGGNNMKMPPPKM
jgi:hypothetical protein